MIKCERKMHKDYKPCSVQKGTHRALPSFTTQYNNKVQTSQRGFNNTELAASAHSAHACSVVLRICEISRSDSSREKAPGTIGLRHGVVLYAKIRSQSIKKKQLFARPM